MRGPGRCRIISDTSPHRASLPSARFLRSKHPPNVSASATLTALSPHCDGPIGQERPPRRCSQQDQAKQDSLSPCPAASQLLHSTRACINLPGLPHSPTSKGAMAQEPHLHHKPIAPIPRTTKPSILTRRLGPRHARPPPWMCGNNHVLHHGPMDKQARTTQSYSRYVSFVQMPQATLALAEEPQATLVTMSSATANWGNKTMCENR